MDPISSTEYTVRVQKLVQDTAKREGEAAVELIEQATPQAPPLGPDGQGSLVNTTA
jgi:hypothetical protein